MVAWKEVKLRRRYFINNLRKVGGATIDNENEKKKQVEIPFALLMDIF